MPTDPFVAPSPNGFRSLVISNAAARTAAGRVILDRFQAARLPVEQLESDTAVVSRHLADPARTLLVLEKPRGSWVVKAEHGRLRTQANEHHLFPVLGCPSRCSYCYLQAHPSGRIPIRFHVGTENMFEAIEECLSGGDHSGKILFSSGETADSLAMNNLFPVATMLIDFFADLPSAELELRTKSDQVSDLLDLKHNGNTTIGFSVMPEKLRGMFESHTADMSSRIWAARACQDAGYSIAIHFDPILTTENWKSSYGVLIQSLAEKLDRERISTISLGCLRFSAELARIPSFRRDFHREIEAAQWLEYRPGRFNGTLPHSKRLAIYSWMTDALFSCGFQGQPWLSMESDEIHQPRGPLGDRRT